MRKHWIAALPLACLLSTHGARAWYDTGHYTDELNFDVAIPGMLDFDQLRAADPPHTDGLPGDGAMYCAPAAAMNLFAFLANNGYPDLAPHEGDWSDHTDQNAYYDITENLADLGVLMSTTTADGTDSDDWLTGATSWLAPYSTGSNRLLAKAFLRSSGYTTTVDRLAYYATFALVEPCYSYYDGNIAVPSVLGDRLGGHCVTYSSASRSGSTLTELAVMNPVSSDSDLSQSVMAESVLITGDIPFLDAGIVSVIWSTYESGDLEVIDKFYLIQRLSALLVDPSARALVVQQPGLGGSGSESRRIDVPGTVREAILRPDLLFASAVTRESAALPAQAWLVDVRRGTSTPLLSAGTVRLAFSRFLELYASSGREIRRYDVDTGQPVLLGSTTLSMTPAALEWMDEVDQLWALDGAQGRIVALSRALQPSGQLSGDLLFRSLASDAAVRMAAVPGGRLALLSPQRGVVALFERVGNGMAVRARYDGALNAKDVSATDAGTLILATSTGALVELAADGFGRLSPVASNPLAGITTGGVVEVDRSRTNFDAEIHGGPGWSDR